VNLQLVFDQLFGGDWGAGYPSHRAAPQAQSRAQLAEISRAAHEPMTKVLPLLDKQLVRDALTFPAAKAMFLNGSWSDTELMGVGKALIRSDEEDGHEEL
jgi:hypothetical protein